MAAYDALPARGGTIYICSIYTNAINWTTTGQGAWIMGPSDPNYASPRTGWRKLKSAKFIGACPDTGGSDGPVNYVNMNGALGPAIWISSTTGQGARLDFENFLLQYQKTNVVIGVDSNGNQTTGSACGRQVSTTLLPPFHNRQGQDPDGSSAAVIRLAS